MSEKLHERIAELQEQLRQGTVTRRDFLRYATLLGLSAGAAEALAACAPKATPTTAPPPAPTTAKPATAVATAPPPAAPSPTAAQGQPVVPFPGYAWNPPYVGFHINYDKCTGCRICEGACSIKNFGEFNPELSRIKVWEFYGGIVLVPGACWGCQWLGGSAAGGLDAPCLAACPVTPIKAISWHKTLNIPVVDEKLCIKCGLCYQNCAQKAIKVNPKTQFPNVCTRCGEGDPECVKQGPFGALEPRKTATGVEYALGTRTPEQIAQDLIEHRFYPWAGLEDWKKVGV
jgi:Fe-S-cluster-containing hydrogenase component 2